MEILLKLLFFLGMAVCFTAAEAQGSTRVMQKATRVGERITFSGRKPPPDLGKILMTRLGLTREDLNFEATEKELISRQPGVDLASRLTPMEVTKNTVDGMIKTVMMMDGNHSEADPLLQNLLDVANEVNSTMKISPKISPIGMKQKAEDFQKRVEDILKHNGIEVVLPFDCGRNPLNENNPLEQELLPWIAALGSREDGRFHYRCIGIVITEYHILTDGDCVASSDINIIQLNVTGIIPEPFAIENFVAGRQLHPDIKDMIDFMSGKNIGLLELASPLEFNDYVQPVCLPGIFDKPDPDADYNSTVVSFNPIVDTPQGRRAALSVLPNSLTFGSATCFEVIKTLNRRRNEENILYTILNKNHVCVAKIYELVGKSVVLEADERTGRVRLIGVAGIANAEISNPIAYSLVQPQRFWIERVIKEFMDNKKERN